MRQRVAVCRNGLCPDKRPLHRPAAVLCPDLRRLLLEEPGVCEASQKTATRGGSGRPVAAGAVGAAVLVAVWLLLLLWPSLLLLLLLLLLPLPLPLPLPLQLLLLLLLLRLLLLLLLLLLCVLSCVLCEV